eukprot:COSAG05_NODE_1136_length_5755_cov_4.734441_5_plen_278_part_00
MYFGFVVCVYVPAVAWAVVPPPDGRQRRQGVVAAVLHTAEAATRTLSKHPMPVPVPGPAEPPPGPCIPDNTFKGAAWYDTYARAVRAVRPYGPCPDCVASTPRADEVVFMCSRWWHASPQRLYENRHNRALSWRPQNRTGGASAAGEGPHCDWQSTELKAIVPPGASADSWASNCSTGLEKLFKALDAVDVVYYPRAGTELAFVRGGTVSDTDIDIFVDMPSTQLLQALQPLMHNVGKLVPVGGNGILQELHWQSPCALGVHMILSGKCGSPPQFRP